MEGNTNIKINADKPQMTFVFPSFYDLERGMAFTHSLGIGYIRANLAQHHIPTAQYIQYQPRTVPQTAREILDMGADIVGFSCVDGSFYPCIIIANAIKKMKSDTTIVFGGPAVTLAADMIMKQNQCIDICCRGECEETCYELLLRLKANGEINDIPGVSYRSNGGVRHAPDRPLIHRGKKGEELDFLPSPYLANMIPTDSDLPEDEFQLAILTSRGCTHKCTYCTNTMLGRNRVRFHSVDRVIAELKYLSRKCKPFQKVVFFDDTFTLNINRAKQICRRMFDESLHHLDYECITRFDRCDEELFKLFAQVGIRCVAFGLESASPEVLNRIKKVRSTRAVNGDYGPEQRFVDTIKQNIALSKKYRIRASLSIMVGLPGETPGEANATLDFIKELNLNSYNHNYLIPIYGTELFNQCDNYGISVKPSPFQLPFITDYSYDVYAREPLENSLVHQEFARRNQQGIEILFSIFVGVQQKMHQFLHPENTALFITDPPRLDDGDLFLWLSPILHFNSDIFITEQQWDFQTRQHRYQLFARANIPVVQYRRLKVKREEKKCGPNQNDTVETYDMENFSKTLLSTKKYSYKHGADYTYHLLPLNCDYPSPIDLDNQIKLRSIGSMEDISQLVKGCENHSHSLKITGAQLSHFDFEIVDKCRWSGQLCKALELKKLIIKGNKDVYTCYSGQPLGQVGMPFDQLKIELAASQEEMVKRRGCPDCPVLESCPQCMYLPSFLSESNYCRVMQQYKNISIAMELPGLMRQLRIQKADEIKELEYLQISWIDKKRVKSILLPAKQEQENSSGFPGWLLKIDFNNRHFLYYTEKSEFSVLSGTMSEMWDLIRDQPVDDREAICQRLAKTHHISYNALFNTFDMFCKKIGNLISRAY